MTLTQLIDQLVSELERDSTKVKYGWQESLENASQETDPLKRPAQIARAETDVYARRHWLNYHEGSSEERKLLDAAMDQLTSLRADT
jgi:hypothetical protein